MKNILQVVLTIVLISGCFGQTENESDLLSDSTIIETETLQEILNTGDDEENANPDIISFEDPPENIKEVTDFLKHFLVVNRVDSFVKAINDYKIITTDKKLIKFYRNEADFIINAISEGMKKSHPNIEYAGDSSPATAWSWINKFLPLRTECLSSEGESEAYKYLPDFFEKAKTTKGKLDDELFKLLNTYYEGYDNTWLTIGYDNAGCDYCGYSTFGNKKHIQLFKEIIAIEKETEFLDPELRKLVASMVDFGGSAFSSSQADILTEIDAFLALKDSTRFDLSALEKERERVAKGGERFIFECTYEDFVN